MKIGDVVVDPSDLARLCKESDISYLALFGSYLRGDNRKDSDMDLLVRFKEVKSLFELVDVKDKFEQKLGKPVDLVTEKFLSPYFRDEVVKRARVLYEEE